MRERVSSRLHARLVILFVLLFVMGALYLSWFASSDKSCKRLTALLIVLLVSRGIKTHVLVRNGQAHVCVFQRLCFNRRLHGLLYVVERFITDFSGWTKTTLLAVLVTT